jgi:uncharacterized protein (TIGR02594 family)
MLHVLNLLRLQTALRYLGVREAPGAADNPVIQDFHASTEDEDHDGDTPDSVSWCSSLRNKIEELVGGVGTDNKAARSWLKWGRSTKHPQPGDTVVFWRESPSSWKGHVALFLAWSPAGNLITFDGNIGDAAVITVHSKARVIDFRTDRP